MNSIIFMPLALMIAGTVAVAPATDPAVALEIDLSALPDNDVTEYINDNLVERGVRVLHEGGVEVADDADSTILVTVSRYGDGDIHYEFTVALLEYGTKVVIEERTLTCELCRESDLFAKVGQEVARISGRLLYSTTAVTDGGEGEDEGGETEGTQPETQPEEIEPHERARRVGAAGYVGIALAGAGTGAAIFGLVALSEPPVRMVYAETDRSASETRSRRPLVGGLVGAGLMLAGAALIAVDQTVLLENRRRSARSISVVPSFSPTGASLSWVVQF